MWTQKRLLIEAIFGYLYPKVASMERHFLGTMWISPRQVSRYRELYIISRFTLLLVRKWPGQGYWTAR